LSGGRYAWKLAFGDHAVDHSVRHRLLRIHDVIAIHIAFDFLHRLAGGVGEDLIQNRTRSQDLARMDVDIRRLPAQAAGMRLVNQDS